jgi:hypothetical protein
MTTVITVSVSTNATPAVAHAITVPIPLYRIFTAYGPLRTVVRTTDQTGDWSRAGETRVNHLSDGSVAPEKLRAEIEARPAPARTSTQPVAFLR